MAASATNTYTGAGIAEDFQDIIFDISPEDTRCRVVVKIDHASPSNLT